MAACARICFHHNYGFGWFLHEFRGHRVAAHGGSTGTFILRLPDDKLTVILLSNLGEAPTSDPQSMARSVAGRYIPEILLGSLREEADPDPQRTLSMKNVLFDIANEVKDSPLLAPETQRLSPVPPAGNWTMD
ncbi:MAG: serine hydrolase [Nitrospira sp.]|nr:serine hydrolase [Nitrospira sp.]